MLLFVESIPRVAAVAHAPLAPRILSPPLLLLLLHRLRETGSAEEIVSASLEAAI